MTELRKFECLVDEFALDDFPDFSGAFTVQCLTKGKIYTEQNPDNIDTGQKGVIIDDNSCWHRYGENGFHKKFKQIL